MTEGTAKFFLLQVNDALFPIGGYSHSYGLETYIQKGIVHDEDSAEEFIHKRLEYNFLYNEFLAVRLGWEYAVSGDLTAISRLEEIMESGKIPRETREASRKLGSRFIKTLSALEIPRENRGFEEYREERKKRASCSGIRCFLRGGRDHQRRGTGTFSVCADLCNGHKLCKNDSVKPVFRAETFEWVLPASPETDQGSERARGRMARTFRPGI